MDGFLTYITSLFAPKKRYLEPDLDILDSLRTRDELRAYISSLIYPTLPTRRHAFATGADIPPEIFPNILRFISVDDRTEQVQEMLQDSGWHSFLIDTAVVVSAPAYTLKNCSLVSAYWANQCRRYMFLGRRMHITSYEQAMAFRHYATIPSSRLVPICSLIKHVDAVQRYPDSSAFFHLLYLPSTRDKLRSLRVEGYADDQVSRLPRSTFQWSLPQKTAMLPVFTTFRNIYIVRLRFPSFQAVVDILRCCKEAKHFNLISLTWDKASASATWNTMRSAFRKKNYDTISIAAMSCTDNLHVSLQLAMSYPDSPLRVIPFRDRQLALGVMRALYDHLCPLAGKGDTPTCSVQYDRMLSTDQLQFLIDISCDGHPRYHLQFICQPKELTTQCTGYPEPLRLSGLLLTIQYGVRAGTTTSLPSLFDFTALRAQLVDLCTVVLGFSDYSVMKIVLEKHAALRERLDGQRGYAFVCQRVLYGDWARERVLRPWEKESIGSGHGTMTTSWVGVDPETLELTGRIWGGANKVVPEMLREQREGLEEREREPGRAVMTAGRCPSGRVA
ncbi:hypothetical protein BDW22DRAFT_7345 [Trametopsis cervina]|nr:hypothetical protein BDW22DRAFT_7345 [Trametopsis cervina]